jgi:hypothetical protein
VHPAAERAINHDRLNDPERLQPDVHEAHV